MSCGRYVFLVLLTSTVLSQANFDSLDTYSPAASFGGLYYKGLVCSNSNPFASSKCDCPGGTQKNEIYSHISDKLYECDSGSLAQPLPNLPFGGLFNYESSDAKYQSINPISGSYACPKGFKASTFDKNANWSLCVPDGYNTSDYAIFYTFGGLFSKQNHLFNNSAACPAPFQKVDIEPKGWDSFHYCWDVACNSTVMCTGHGNCSINGSCQCEDGWTGNNCSTCFCNGHGTCPKNDHPCQCQTGWNGTFCTQCSSKILCYGRGQCDNTTGACTCDQGWLPDNCSSCDPQFWCTGHGVCNSSTLNCTCSPGWKGDKCDQCDAVVYCSGRGTCTVDGSNATCNCSKGWIGVHCEMCDAKVLCKERGNCDNSTGACSCFYGWCGKNCEGCNATEMCSAHGKCSNDTGNCTCDYPAWSGQNCSICNATYLCTDRGKCDELGNCTCEDGWEPPDCARCNSTYWCHEHGTCDSDTLKCHCKKGWTEASNCSSCDSSFWCSPNGDCVVDKYGNVTCKCHSGWIGPLCNICDSKVICNGHGQCNNATGNCNCTKGYLGNHCDTCDPIVWCTGHGNCTLHTSSVTCSCLTGWNGEKCDQCDPDILCSGHGNCSAVDGSCECDEEWMGDRCELCNIYYFCSGNGDCVNSDTDVSCLCYEGWCGGNCSQCESAYWCSGYGNCTVDDNSTVSCLCNSGWEGANCNRGRQYDAAVATLCVLALLLAIAAIFSWFHFRESSVHISAAQLINEDYLAVVEPSETAVSWFPSERSFFIALLEVFCCLGFFFLSLSALAVVSSVPHISQMSQTLVYAIGWMVLDFGPNSSVTVHDALFWGCAALTFAIFVAVVFLYFCHRVGSFPVLNVVISLLLLPLLRGLTTIYICSYQPYGDKESMLYDPSCSCWTTCYTIPFFIATFSIGFLLWTQVTVISSSVLLPRTWHVIAAFVKFAAAFLAVTFQSSPLTSTSIAIVYAVILASGSLVLVFVTLYFCKFHLRALFALGFLFPTISALLVAIWIGDSGFTNVVYPYIWIVLLVSAVAYMVLAVGLMIRAKKTPPRQKILVTASLIPNWAP